MHGRFTQAIVQLGHENPDVRVGAIYALEQILKTSRPERRAIIELLSCYVQSHAPDPPGRKGQPPPGIPQGESPLRGWARDVQAAMTVLGRRPRTTLRETLRGEGSNSVREAYASAAVNVSGSDLRGCELGDADLARTLLYRCQLQRAVLKHANLTQARMERVALGGADLRDAVLQHTQLVGASLVSADLGGVDMKGANLRGTQLHGALLQGVRNLEHADLEGAEGDRDTAWPEGFDWRARGVRETERRPPAGPDASEPRRERAHVDAA